MINSKGKDSIVGKINGIVRRVLCASMALGMLALAGCGTKDTVGTYTQGTTAGTSATTETTATGTASGISTSAGSGSKYVLNPVDGTNYNPCTYSFNSIMKCDTGYYYQQSYSYEYHYYDNDTKQSIYLCSRPECLHQGDEFCTATNYDYFVLANQIYDGEIYILAGSYGEEGNDPSYVKLLRIDPDGTNMTEIAQIEEIQQDNFGVYGGSIFIHRGVCFLSYLNTSDHMRLGEFYVYDMNDNTMKYHKEEKYEKPADGSYSQAMDPNIRFLADGEFVYYADQRVVTINGKQKTQSALCRYDIETAAIDEAALEGIFKGTFTIGANGETVYTDSFGHISKYDWDRKVSTRFDDILLPIVEYYEDGTYGYSDEIEVAANISEIIYYNGQYIAFDGIGLYGSTEIYLDYDPILKVIILDENMKCVEWHDISEMHVTLRNDLKRMYTERYGYEIPDSNYSNAMNIVDDDIYFQSPIAVYKCPMEDFIHGKVDFEFMYETEAYIVY